MKGLQRFGSVEYAVMHTLQECLVPSFEFSSVIDYVNKDVEPKAYSSLEVFKKDYAFSSLLRKWKGFKEKSIDPTEKAFETWTKSEQQCFNTNRRLYLESSTGSYSVAPASIIAAQRKIAQVLGPLEFENIVQLCRFGNGATSDLRRGSTHAEKSRNSSVTFDALPWVCKAVSGDEYLATLIGPFQDLKIERANRMVMVPKTVKTHRPIAAEPTLNGFVQQGVGRYIRKRLRRFGVNLNDQTNNQVYASMAQKMGLSTIDLSSASDTLCINLVKLLLPREWFEMLDDLRSKNTTFRGKTYHLSKFSSMGNAFTFELESLIFYSLLEAVRTTDVSSVYGDDMIVSNCDYSATIEILLWAGFTVNDDKSFSEGSRFYESCGKHYFDSEEVTPCYQKDVCSRPHDFVRFHNRLVRAGLRLNLRNEFNAAASVVRDWAVKQFGRKCPGVGPLVEYDEYFIKETYAWADPLLDRVKIKSAVTLPLLKEASENWQMTAYLGRKLRSPAFKSPDRKGQSFESVRPKLLVIEKYHWRSATVIGDTPELPEDQVPEWEC